MPEGFTYNDMKRRAVASLEDVLKSHNMDTTASIEVEAEVRMDMGSYCLIPSEEAKYKKSRQKPPAGLQKKKHMAENPHLYTPNVDHSFPNYKSVPATHRKDDRIPFKLSTSQILSYGKAFGISTQIVQRDPKTSEPTSQLFISIFLALHGHIITLSRAELQRWRQQWSEKPNLGPFVQLLIIPRDDKIDWILAVSDQNKLSTVSFARSTDGLRNLPPPYLSHRWFNTNRDYKVGCCPLNEWKDFHRALNHGVPSRALRWTSKNIIYFDMTENNVAFNGIGTSHAIEILHRAYIHPLESTAHIFRDPNLRNRFLDAINDFFEDARNPKSVYNTRVSARTSGGSCLPPGLDASAKH